MHSYDQPKKPEPPYKSVLGQTGRFTRLLSYLYISIGEQDVDEGEDDDEIYEFT